MTRKILLEEGMTFGHLTYLHEVEPHNRKRHIEVQCTCGKVFIVGLSDTLRRVKENGDVRCRSCSIAEINKRAKYKHGLHKDPTYHVWAIAKQRCYNSKAKDYGNYGGRGITMCNEWREDYKAFHDWMYANGYKQGLQLDRIDNSKGYSPDNCRLVTPRINSNNTRLTHYIDGEPASLWFEKQNHHPSVTYSCFCNRFFRRNWDLDHSLLTPNRYLNSRRCRNEFE